MFAARNTVAWNNVYVGQNKLKHRLDSAAKRTTSLRFTAKRPVWPSWNTLLRGLRGLRTAPGGGGGGGGLGKEPAAMYQVVAVGKATTLTHSDGAVVSSGGNHEGESTGWQPRRNLDI